MRLKTFSAPTMTQAMAEVRAALGRDAVIVSSFEGRQGTGVQITAALEDSIPQPPVFKEDTANATIDGRAGSSSIGEALSFHGLPQRLTERLTSLAQSMEAEDIEQALAGALDAGFNFAPLNLRPGQPIMLIGQPGAGKSVSVAKLAARTVMSGAACRVISTDTIRAGGIAQLKGFTDILQVPLETAKAPDELRHALAAAADDEIVLIDSPGTNPFSHGEVKDLKRFLIKGIEPVLVMAAGGDASEAADIAAAFRPLGARRIIFTRLDATRRYGAITAAADASGMTLGDVSLSPFVAEGLKTINPISLARLMLKQGSSQASLPGKEEKAAE